MDLLVCSRCGRRFYLLSGAGPAWCSHCGGNLEVALDHIASIPLDARWLDPGLAARAPGLTIVDLRRKRQRDSKSSRRIVRHLAHYFDVRGHGRSLEVMVNRGESETAALRVAAVLDGVDADWEQHFYLPTVDREESVWEPQRPLQPARNHLHLVDSPQNGAEPGGQHG
jgi:hypothetical protein